MARATTYLSGNPAWSRRPTWPMPAASGLTARMTGSASLPAQHFQQCELLPGRVGEWEAGKSAIFWQGQSNTNQGLHLGIDINTSYPNIGILTCSFWNNDLAYILPNPRAWHHVACTAEYNYDSAGHNRRRLYVDGAQVGEDFPTSWYTGSGELGSENERRRPGPGTSEAPSTRQACSRARLLRRGSPVAAQNCLAQPVRPNGHVKPTYQSTDASAVQQAEEPTGAAGGRARFRRLRRGATGR